MHRAEEILESVKSALTGLSTTAESVKRDRVYPPEELPALSINQGTEEPLDDSQTFTFQDCILSVEVVIQLKSSELTAQLNKIKSEVYAAIIENPQLGLSYVHNTYWRGDSAPTNSGDAETKTTRCIMRFDVFYRHSYQSKIA